MASTLKQINLHIRFDDETYETFLRFIKETGLSKTKSIEKAIKRYMDYYNETGKI